MGFFDNLSSYVIENSPLARMLSGLPPTEQADYYDPGRSVAENVRDPRSLAQAMNVALGFSGGGLGIKAYHGSPHDFASFDMSKIGTGEGAQAYGHGMYFAENPNVAESYRAKLTRGGGYGPIPSDVRGALKAMDYLGFESPGEALAAARSHADWQARWPGLPSGEDAPFYEIVQKYLDATRRGRMYEVNINADPQQFIQWDKPFMDQPQNIQDTLSQHVAALQRSGGSMMSGYIRDLNRGTLPGGSVYYGLGRGNAPSASDAWSQVGVPGIRYFDQLSRGGREGTSNYVVFNPSIIDILRKYGLSGLMAGGGATALGDQP